MKGRYRELCDDPVDRYLQFKNDPWLFMLNCCFTKDQVDRNNPIKLLPDREYGKLYVKALQTYPLNAVPKTRRMTMSWYTISYLLWDTIFHMGRFNAFVSKKEDDADELVKRALFIYDHIPSAMISRDILPRAENKFCALAFPDIDSKIQGFPQGADQLRQFTFSSIFGDESAFWDEAQEFYAASFPTIEGGGRMTLVSSPAPGFFKKLCFDAIDVTGDIDTNSYLPNPVSPMQGVRLWRNKKNKFMVFELHYTADPEKRDPSFKESIKNSMPLQEYLREYELHWDTFAGQPVYPEFSKLHVVHNPMPSPQPGLPMLIGFDFGLTPAAVVGQYSDGQLTIFWECVEVNMGAVRFLPRVISELRLRFPTYSNLKKDWRCFIDPSGATRSDTDEAACMQIVAANGFIPSPGPVAWETRRKAVVDFLQKLTKEGPAFQIYAPDCPMLVKGFEGGYRFSDKHVEIEPNKLRPIKDQYSHPHDALQYLCWGILGLSAQMKRSIPRPGYSISGGYNNGTRSYR